MPANLHLPRLNSRPPRFELFAGKVMRGRRNQMIKDYDVMLAPPKPRQRRKIIAIKQLARRAAFPDSAEWPVNQLGGEKKDCGRYLRKMKKCTRVEPRSEIDPQGINQAGYPAIVLGAINPCRHVSAWFDLRRQRAKTFD